MKPLCEAMLPNQNAKELKLKSGDNQLSTCFQFVVADASNSKVMTLKIYDKTMDLIGREGTKPVGSRLPYLLGSRLSLEPFHQTLRKAQYSGMTRIEISFHLDNSP